MDVEIQKSNLFELLPNELILQIFKAGLQCGLDLVDLSLVCHLWRSLIINCTQLWSSIYLSYSKSSLHIAPIFFERSKPQLVDLTLSYLTLNSIDHISRLLPSEMERVRRLEIRSDNFDMLPRLAKVCSVSPATSLTTLKLQYDLKIEWDCNCGSHDPIVRHAASLRSVILKGVCPHMAPPLIGLTHLEIHGFSPSFAEFYDLFAANPTLSSLSLPGLLPKRLPNESYSLIDASSLRSFAVGLGLHWGAGKCDCLLTFLKMENLEYLEIIGDLHTRHFSRVNGLQKVRTLRFHHLKLAPDPVDKTFWSALGEVTRVELYDLRGFLGILSASPNEPYLPKLTSILFYSCGILDNDYELSDFDAVCARNALGLSRVEVPSNLKDSPHQCVKTKLDSAGIELMFVNTRNTASLVQCDRDSDIEDFFDGSDEWSDHVYSDDDFYSEEYEDDFDEDDEYAF